MYFQCHTVQGDLQLTSGYDAWIHKFECPFNPQASLPGRYINVRCCVGLSTILLKLNEPLGMIRDEKRNSISPKLLKGT